MNPSPNPIIEVLRDACLSGSGTDARRVAQSLGFCEAGIDKYGLWGAFEIDGVVQRMRWIEPGDFVMGGPEDEEGRFNNEEQREITITTGFWLGDTPVTQALYEAVTGKNPSRLRGAAQPVEQVSWHDALAFCASLAAQALSPRVPSEAEWEYACRAGTTGARYAGLDEVAWHYGNSDSQTHPVGAKAPNPWGLYDTLGNVWEWCHEVHRKGSKRVIRGGSWYDVARDVRAASRITYEPGHRYDFLGFRLAGGSALEGTPGAGS